VKLYLLLFDHYVVGIYRITYRRTSYECLISEVTRELNLTLLYIVISGCSYHIWKRKTKNTNNINSNVRETYCDIQTNIIYQWQLVHRVSTRLHHALNTFNISNFIILSAFTFIELIQIVYLNIWKGIERNTTKNPINLKTVW